MPKFTHIPLDARLLKAEPTKQFVYFYGWLSPTGWLTPKSAEDAFNKIKPDNVAREKQRLIAALKQVRSDADSLFNEDTSFFRQVVTLREKSVASRKELGEVDNINFVIKSLDTCIDNLLLGIGDYVVFDHFDEFRTTLLNKFDVEITINSERNANLADVMRSDLQNFAEALTADNTNSPADAYRQLSDKVYELFNAGHIPKAEVLDQFKEAYEYLNSALNLYARGGMVAKVVATGKNYEAASRQYEAITWEQYAELTVVEESNKEDVSAVTSENEAEEVTTAPPFTNRFFQSLMSFGNVAYYSTTEVEITEQNEKFSDAQDEKLMFGDSLNSVVLAQPMGSLRRMASLLRIDAVNTQPQEPRAKLLSLPMPAEVLEATVDVPMTSATILNGLGGANQVEETPVVEEKSDVVAVVPNNTPVATKPSTPAQSSGSEVDSDPEAEALPVNGNVKAQGPTKG